MKTKYACYGPFSVHENFSKNQSFHQKVLKKFVGGRGGGGGEEPKLKSF